MRQWQKRNDIDNMISVFSYKEYTLNTANQWERFTVIGKKIMLLSDLQKAIEKLQK